MGRVIFKKMNGDILHHYLTWDELLLVGEPVGSAKLTGIGTMPIVNSMRVIHHGKPTEVTPDLIKDDFHEVLVTVCNPLWCKNSIVEHFVLAKEFK